MTLVVDIEWIKTNGEMSWKAVNGINSGRHCKALFGAEKDDIGIKNTRFRDVKIE